jgi:hypothetical protein
MESSRGGHALPCSRLPPEQQLASEFIPPSGTPLATEAREWGGPSERSTASTQQRLVQATSDIRLDDGRHPPRVADMESHALSDQQSAAALNRLSVAGSDRLLAATSDSTSRLWTRCRGCVILATASFW